jgi:hypothetical protein
MSTINEILGEMRPTDAFLTEKIFPVRQRVGLFEEIVGQDPQPVRQIHTARRGRKLFDVGSWSRGPVLAPTLGIVIAIVIGAGVLVTRSAVAPEMAAGAVKFRTTASGDVVATVTDPFAAASELQQAFADRGFDIKLNLVPVSPSLVGTVVYVSDDGGRSAIQPLQKGHCLNGGGGCMIGVRIPATFSGTGYITLGRPARAGETYESQASAFAVGEPLHCSGVLGSRVSSALPVLEKARLAVEWRELTTQTSADGTQVSHSTTDASPVLGNYIWDADMMAPGKVAIWSSSTPWPADATHGAQFNEGC